MVENILVFILNFNVNGLSVFLDSVFWLCLILDSFRF